VATLRQRNKARTREEIRDQAMRLFAKQGYAATTVEQIADAAGVSASTYFRYFPSKEDLVIDDGAEDALLVDAVLAQPADLSPVQAICAAMHEFHATKTAAERRQERVRHALVLATPELRARSLDSLSGGLQTLADAIAARSGHSAADFAVRNLAGAVVGISVAALFASAEDPSADYHDLLQKGLLHLDAGLPL
jgi:AcrR family transcriptional regulator